LQFERETPTISAIAKQESAMLTQPISGACAWTAASIDAPSSWYYPLPEACVAALGKVQASGAADVTAVRLDDATRAACAEALRPVRAALESGRGFAIVEGPAGGRLTAENATLLYWIVGLGLGRPFAQNVQGTLLYDVRDTGQDVAKGARFSVTNYESSFHTDNSFGSGVLDYVGLLCLQTAKAGGRSQVVSGCAVHNELLARQPEVLAALYQPFHVDRRGGIHEGESPTVQFPVIRNDGRELLFRYLRYWIEAGHEKIAQPLTKAQLTALNTLDEFLQRRDLRAEFDLKPGQMYFINNRWILHNRTAFEDHPELERRRHLVRLWLQATAPPLAA
jgi:alpha-ketoglutarate-dependent taurine dioxygenase